MWAGHLQRLTALKEQATGNLVLRTGVEDQAGQSDIAQETWELTVSTESHLMYFKLEP